MVRIIDPPILTCHPCLGSFLKSEPSQMSQFVCLDTGRALSRRQPKGLDWGSGSWDAHNPHPSLPCRALLCLPCPTPCGAPSTPTYAQGHNCSSVPFACPFTTTLPPPSGMAPSNNEPPCRESPAKSPPLANAGNQQGWGGYRGPGVPWEGRQLGVMVGLEQWKRGLCRCCKGRDSR